MLSFTNAALTAPSSAIRLGRVSLVARRFVADDQGLVAEGAHLLPIELDVIFRRRRPRRRTARSARPIRRHAAPAPRGSVSRLPQVSNRRLRSNRGPKCTIAESRRHIVAVQQTEYVALPRGPAGKACTDRAYSMAESSCHRYGNTVAPLAPLGRAAIVNAQPMTVDHRWPPSTPPILPGDAITHERHRPEHTPPFTQKPENGACACIGVLSLQSGVPSQYRRQPAR